MVQMNNLLYYSDHKQTYEAKNRFWALTRNMQSIKSLSFNMWLWYLIPYSSTLIPKLFRYSNSHFQISLTPAPYPIVHAWPWFHYKLHLQLPKLNDSDPCHKTQEMMFIYSAPYVYLCVKVTRLGISARVLFLDSQFRFMLSGFHNFYSQLQL